MNDNIIKTLETKLGTKKLEFEEILKIVNDPEINKELTLFLENKTELTTEDIRKISSNPNVFEILDFFAIQQSFEEDEFDDDLVDLGKFPMYYYSKFANSVPIYTKEEEIAKFKKLENSKSPEERIEIRNEIAEHNLRLVLKIANIYSKKMNNNYAYYEDYVQFGNIGLMNAIDRFEVDKGFKFSTMASWWIYQSISRGSMETERTIRVPVYVYQLENKLYQVKEQYFRETGIEKRFSLEEIENLAKEYGVSTTIINLALEKNTTLSLENKVKRNEEEDEFKDFIEDSESIVEDIVVKNDTVNKIRELIKTSGLDERDQKILIRRYGLYDTEPQKRHTIGSEFGISRERVRQIENKSIEKLAIAAKKRGLNI